MKSTLIERHAARATRANETRPSRYQIFRQARAGNYLTEFKTDSAAEAVEFFEIMSPAFDGGAIRVWDHREQRVCASVQWKTEKTAFGFPVRTRENVFHDRLLGVLARQLLMREETREAIQQNVRMSV